MYIEDQSVAPDIDLFTAIEELKQERDAVILAHYYQDPDIQDIADHLGDSLRLSQIATQSDAEVVLLCGVHFMAETVKILNPDKMVLIPDLRAGCSLADSCPPDRFQAFLEQYADHTVISYINTSAAVKALSDIICTSANAEQIIASVPEDQPILFAPDRHMGKFLIGKTGRDMTLWDGVCVVHDIFSETEILRLKAEHPDAELLAHPECDEHILRLADHIGSTTSIIRYAKRSATKAFIIATEEGVIHQMKKESPEKTFIPAPTTTGCACNQCPYMRLNSLEKIYLALKNLQPEVVLDESIRIQALKPLERMLLLS